MFGKFFKVATGAGLLGLAILHADDFATVAGKLYAVFPAAIGLSTKRKGQA